MDLDIFRIRWGLETVYSSHWRQPKQQWYEKIKEITRQKNDI